MILNFSLALPDLVMFLKAKEITFIFLKESFLIYIFSINYRKVALKT